MKKTPIEGIHLEKPDEVNEKNMGLILRRNICFNIESFQDSIVHIGNTPHFKRGYSHLILSGFYRIEMPIIVWLLFGAIV